jgi:hypothetical protein
MPQQDFVSGAKIVKYSAEGDTYNRFKGVLRVDRADIVEGKRYCVVKVLPNDLCVFQLPNELADGLSVVKIENHLRNASSVTLKGKKKKNAVKIKADSKLCTLLYIDGSVCDVYCPLSGKLIEINDALAVDNGLKLQSEHDELVSGSSSNYHQDKHKYQYLAVISPNNEIPPADTDIGMFVQNKTICWAFSKGECTRGDACKFDHIKI